MQVRLQLLQLHQFPNRLTVIDHMEVGDLKINHPFACPVLDVRIPNVPFQGNCPIEHLRPTCHFVNFEGNPLLHQAESFTNSLRR